MKSLAYNHATMDDRLMPLVPMDRVISLQETRAMYAGEHPRKMSVAAEKYSFPVSRIAPEILDEKLLSRTSILINDCYALPEGMAERLLRWVRSGANRILLLHGVCAGRKIDGTMWSEAFGWNKTTINAPDQFGDVLGGLRFAEGRTLAGNAGENIFADAGGPALSFYPQGNGSGIYFYSHTPGIDSERDARILKAIFLRHGIALPVRSAGKDLYVRGYQGRHGLVFVVFDKKSLDSYNWVYSATDNGLYPWHVTSRRNSETVAVPPGEYLLFGMLSGKEQKVVIKPGNDLKLELRNLTAEVFHLVKADDVATLEKLHRQHHDLFRFPAQRKK